MMGKSKKLLSSLLALAMVLGLFAAMPPTARAAHDVDTIDMDVFNFGTDVLAGAGYYWTYDSASKTITVTDNVTVIGTITGATNTLVIDIAAGKRVTWAAAYSVTFAGQVINKKGSGTLDINSGSISGAGGATIVVDVGTVTVSGGNVTNTAGYAINVTNASNVTVSGGTVSATTGTAIYATGDVTVSGGTVSSASGDETINAVGNVTVNGAGKVENTGAGDAIYTTGVSATVAVIGGGEVTASTGVAITATGASATVNISGGTVSAGGTSATIYTTGNVTVSGGSVSATTGTAIEAAQIAATGTATISSNSGSTAVKMTGNSIGLNAQAGSDLTIIGNVELNGDTSFALSTGGGKLTINGNVTDGGTTKSGLASDSGSTMTVNGNVDFSVAGSYISSATGGKVYITGTATSGAIVQADAVNLTVDTVGDFTPNGLSFNGYYWDVYTDAANPQSYVYLRKGAIPVPLSGGGGGWIPSAPTKPVPEAPKPAFPASGKVVGNRITVYKLETLKTTLYRLNKGDAFTVLGIANNGKAFHVEKDGREGYVALKDIGITFDTPIKATAMKKAPVYSKLENGKLKRIGHYTTGQELWIHGISGKYLINKQPSITYYLDAAQWKLWLPQ